MKEHYGKFNLTCPYCDFEYSSDWMTHLKDDGDFSNATCPICERYFEYMLNVEVRKTFTSWVGPCSRYDEKCEFQHITSLQEEGKNVTVWECQKCGESIRKLGSIREGKPYLIPLDGEKK